MSKSLIICATLLLVTACSGQPTTRHEKITAALLQIDDVPMDWRISSDTQTSAKPLCEGQAYWRTLRPVYAFGPYHLVQQVIYDCATAAEGQRAIRLLTRPIVRSMRPREYLPATRPDHSDDFTAYCDFKSIGTRECKAITRHGKLISSILTVNIVGMPDWPTDEDLLHWVGVRNDLMMARLAQ
jgi:hypothetical protein